MKGEIKAVHFKEERRTMPEGAKLFAPEHAAKANAFHRSFPEYQPTPLADLRALARELGVAGIYVKDESLRFGLNAFKVLGGSYCLGRYIAGRLGRDISELSYAEITDEAVKRELGSLTFVTATDGNHGRGIAWTANRIGQNSVVYMPHGSAAERLANIRALGADASITDLNYDDTVRLASSMAEKNGWILVQDTAWPGYETVPTWIMQGYTSMGCEIVEQLKGGRPTHIFLQAGVGAMAGAMAGFFACFYGAEDRPRVIIVEPDRADCIYRTALANDGTLHAVQGGLNTIMAGLACGEPCTIAWEVLRGCADDFISIPDSVAAAGMRVLANPLEDDPRIVSGESGAATVGLVTETLRREELSELKDSLGLDAASRILCISTEGDTDKENYRRIVWDGLYPTGQGRYAT